MGAEVVSRAMDMMALLDRVPSGAVDAATGREPLPGAVGWPEDDDHDKVAAEVLEVCETLSPETATYLGNHYGMRGKDVARIARADQRLQARLADDRPEILAEVDWAVREEMAATVCDLMIRRTQIFFRNLDQGLSAAEAIATRMAELLGWSEQRRTKEVLAYQNEVARSRRWKSE
jgi:glycerol-3-phosphate dehydrogenase